MKLQLGLILAVLASFSGCCCPMTCAPMCCSNSGWFERLQDGYCDASESMQEQSCRIQHNVSSQMRRLTSSWSSSGECDACSNGCDACAGYESCSDCETCAHGGEYHDGQYPGAQHRAGQYCADQGNCRNAGLNGGDQNCSDSSCRKHGKIKSYPRIDGPRPIREHPIPAVKERRCKRCKQNPCRCGYCEGCDDPAESENFAAGPGNYTGNSTGNYPGNSGGNYGSNYGAASCAAPERTVQPGSPEFQALPPPADHQPPPAPADPAPGPTPVRPPPPGNIKTQTPNTSAALQPQSPPATMSVPLEDGPSLEQIGFRKIAPAGTPDQWQPVRGSKPARYVPF